MCVSVYMVMNEHVTRCISVAYRCVFGQQWSCTAHRRRLFRIIGLTFNLLSNREASPFSLLRQKASDRFGYFHVSSFHFVLGYVTGMEPFSHKLHFPEELGQLYFKWRALHISRRHQCNFPLQYGLISQHFYTLIHNSDIWFSPS